MDKLKLLRDFCQTSGLGSPLVLVSSLFLVQSNPAWAETSPPATVSTVVKEVRQVSDGAGAQYVAYLYDAVDDRALPIWISPNQAFSIATVLSTIRPSQDRSRTT